MKEKQQTSGNRRMRQYWEYLLRNQDFLIDLDTLTALYEEADVLIREGDDPPIDSLKGEPLSPINALRPNSAIDPDEREAMSERLAEKYALEYAEGSPLYELLRGHEPSEECLARMDACWYQQEKGSPFLSLRISPLATASSIREYVLMNKEPIQALAKKMPEKVGTEVPNQAFHDFVWNNRDLLAKKGAASVQDKFSDKKDGYTVYPNEVYKAINREKGRRLTKDPNYTNIEGK
jgi:hypothetical protein